MLWDIQCVPVQVLPPANVSVTATENQEYELRWIKHKLSYSFITQRYQVKYWENNRYEKVTYKARESWIFLCWSNGKAVLLTSVIGAHLLSPDSPGVKHQQWWTSLHLHPADAGSIYRLQGENACKGEYAPGIWGTLERMEWGVHLEDWEWYFSCSCFCQVLVDC